MFRVFGGNSLRWLLLVLMVSGLIGMGFGQAGTAEITGMVSDANGAAVSGARVIVTELATGEAHPAQASESGVYRVNTLKPGDYSVEVQAPGLGATKIERVELSTGVRSTVDVVVRVQAAESVQVNATGAAIEREQSDLQDTIEHESVVQLPLNGRTFISLATLSPGVALPAGTQLPRINGGRPRTNEYLYDGISALQPEPGQVAFFPIIDAIEEFNIQTNGVSAEFGRFNGGVINLTTRAGGDQCPSLRQAISAGCPRPTPS